jgi:hypothetical protein
LVWSHITRAATAARLARVTRSIPSRSESKDAAIRQRQRDFSVAILNNTGLQAGDDAIRRISRFNGLLDHTQRGKPLKRLKPFDAICTGLKPGVNDKRRRHCKAAVVAEH